MSQVRQLSKEGQSIYQRLNVSIITLLSVIFIFYAAFRGQRIHTQLPATYQTTIAPKKLPFNLFSVQLPQSTFEFPAVKICGLQNMTCNLMSSILMTPCDFKFDNTCATLTPVQLESANDLLVITPVLMEGSGLIIWNDTYIPLVKNFHTTIFIKKLTLIDIRKKVTNDYQLDFYSVPSTNNTTTTEFKYKNFKITYERSFLPLDMNNWLGEIGGVGSILYFIHLAAIKIAMSFLLKNARYSDSLYAKAANEAFDQFN